MEKYGTRNIFTYSENEIKFQTSFSEMVAEAFANYAIENCVIFLIDFFLINTLNELKYIEKCRIVEVVNSSIEKDYPELGRNVQQKIIEIWKVFGFLNIEGFLTFTFRDYRDRIVDIVEETFF